MSQYDGRLRIEPTTNETSTPGGGVKFSQAQIGRTDDVDDGCYEQQHDADQGALDVDHHISHCRGVLLFAGRAHWSQTQITRLFTNRSRKCMRYRAAKFM